MAALLSGSFVPVRIPADGQPEVARGFSLSWTPTLVVLHPRGATVRQWIGFLPPDRFLDELELSLALYELRSARPEVAARRLDAVVQAEPAGAAVPEAMYWKGVALYRASGDKAPLWTTWHDLVERFPASAWAARTTLLEPRWVEHPAPPAT